MEKLKEKGIYSDGLIQKIIENHGSVQGVKGVPLPLQKIFKVAHDISWQDHIKMQAAFQSATDNAITKTINMASNVTPKDIEEAYVLAWRLGCKGLTVYRDHTKANQVFEFGGSQNYSEKKMFCPNDNLELIKDGKCYKCETCGFSTCEL